MQRQEAGGNIEQLNNTDYVEMAMMKHDSAIEVLRNADIYLSSTDAIFWGITGFCLFVELPINLLLMAAVNSMNCWKFVPWLIISMLKLIGCICLICTTVHVMVESSNELPVGSIRKDSNKSYGIFVFILSFLLSLLPFSIAIYIWTSVLWLYQIAKQEKEDHPYGIRSIVSSLRFIVKMYRGEYGQNFIDVQE